VLLLDTRSGRETIRAVRRRFGLLLAAFEGLLRLGGLANGLLEQS
jgi:hypothetical protein